MALRIAGAWWQGSQYVEQMDNEVPQALFINQEFAVADAANHPGLIGWGDLAFYADADTPDLSVRPGYVLPDPNAINLGS